CLGQDVCLPSLLEHTQALQIVIAFRDYPALVSRSIGSILGSRGSNRLSRSLTHACPPDRLLTYGPLLRDSPPQDSTCAAHWLEIRQEKRSSGGETDRQLRYPGRSCFSPGCE